MFFFFIIRRPQSSTRTYTRVPYTMLCRSDPEYPAALMSSAAGLFMAGYVRAGVDPAVRAARADPTSIYKALGVVRRYAAAGYMAEASEQFAAEIGRAHV